MLAAPAAIPPRCGGTAAIAEDPSVGVASPTPTPEDESPRISAGQLAEPCVIAAAIRSPTPMHSSPPPMIAPSCHPVQESADAGRHGEGTQRQGNPIRPAWIGVSPSTDCSQIEV